jgi:hypothetical protein
MLDHFMKTHERLNKYNATWLSAPAYHNLTPKNKSHKAGSRSNGKEMKEMGWYLLGVVTQSLRGRSPAQPPIFNHPIECTGALLGLYMYACYKSHDDATLSYMEDALRRFHPFKDVFLLRPAGQEVKAKAYALRTELVKKRQIVKPRSAETCMLSKKWREMNPGKDYIRHGIDISKELEANFNIPKIHVKSHRVNQVRRYGAFQ